VTRRKFAHNFFTIRWLFRRAASKNRPPVRSDRTP
jgi:hypothetical protein